MCSPKFSVECPLGQNVAAESASKRPKLFQPVIPTDLRAQSDTGAVTQEKSGNRATNVAGVSYLSVGIGVVAGDGEAEPPTPPISRQKRLRKRRGTDVTSY